MLGFNEANNFPPRLLTSHDIGVRFIKNKIERQGGFIVLADLKGCEQPPVFGGYRPDIVAYNRNEFYIIEVETPESYKLDHSKKQLQAFSEVGKTILMLPRIVKHRLTPFNQTYNDVDRILTRWNIGPNVKAGYYDREGNTIQYPKF